MSEPLISSTDSIDDNYGRLLRRIREWDRQLNNSTAVCHWCGRSRSRHINDGRCGVAIWSHMFRAVWHEDYNEAKDMLKLIEELLKRA